MSRLATPKLRLTPDLHPGYRLLRLRGSGGFGEVWEAEDSAGTVVALKFLPCARDQGAAHELRSIQIVQGLSHPNLIRIDRVWCAAGFLIVAMELADGSLADLLDVYRNELGGPLPPDHLLPLLGQAATALDFLNNRQHLHNGQWVTVQHCDITPTNLLVFGSTVKLSDFGLTTTLAGRQKVHYRGGTPAFAAPEVFQGRVSDRTDQYALAICYCLLRSGRLPFADSPPDFMTPYSRPAPDLSIVPAAERPALARALAATPQDRWPSSQDLIAELQRVTSPPAKPVARGDSRQHPRYRPGRRVTCEILPTLANQAWATEVQNVSAGGARLHIKKPDCELRPGRLLELILINEARKLSLAVQLRLAHSKEMDNGDYEVGGAFLKPLTPEQVAVFAEGQG